MQKRSRAVGLSVLVCLAAFVWSVLTDRYASPKLHQGSDGGGESVLVHPPSAFVPNLGQWDGDARFVARIGAVSVFVEDAGFTLAVAESPGAKTSPAVAARGAVIGLRFVEGTRTEPIGERRLAGVHNYFLGSDPERWRTGVPRYGAVRHRQPWPGVDVIGYAKDGHLEYDVEVAPGADLTRVQFAIDGAERLAIDPGGDLVMDTPAGTLRQTRPKTFALDGASMRREIVAAYELRGGNRFGFVSTDWREGEMLVLDPGLLWSGLVGGNDVDAAHAMSVDAAGFVTIGGTSRSMTYSTHNPYSHLYWGEFDAVITRLDPSAPRYQQLLYSTFLGGFYGEQAMAVFVDGAGVVTVAGQTNSRNFPTTPGAWSRTLAGYTDIFVARLDPAQVGAAQLVYSTLIGGAEPEYCNSLTVDAGIVTVSGRTDSPAFPTTANAWDTTFGSPSDTFLIRLDPVLTGAQQLLYATFLGGNDYEFPSVHKVDAAGIVTLVGGTRSANYPVTANAWRSSFVGPQEGCVTKLDLARPPSQQLVYSTLLAPGSCAHDVTQDPTGVLTVTGVTYSAIYPVTAGAWSTTLNGLIDVFVTRLDPNRPPAQQLLYSTYLGGSGSERTAISSVDSAGVVTVTGITDSPDFPTTGGAFDRTFRGGLDGYVARVDPARSTLRQLVASTLIGGSWNEDVHALCVEQSGVVTIVGGTGSPDYPVTPGFLYGFGGGTDVFVTRLDLLPTGVTGIGRSSPGCRGALAIGVTSMPQPGNGDFAITCTDAPPHATGAVLLAAAVRPMPILALGVEVWVDPFGAFYLAAGTASDGRGAAELPLPIPNHPWLTGQSFAAQFVWAGPAWPPPCPPLGISATAALEIRIQ